MTHLEEERKRIKRGVKKKIIELLDVYAVRNANRCN